MIDYNVSDHWSADDPDWLKALVSSLDLHHGLSTILPLTTTVSEISEWVQLASGSEAWKPGPNRTSLRLDLLHANGEHTMSEITELFSVGRSTVYRALERSRQKQESRQASDHTYHAGTST